MQNCRVIIRSVVVSLGLMAPAFTSVAAGGPPAPVPPLPATAQARVDMVIRCHRAEPPRSE